MQKPREYSTWAAESQVPQWMRDLSRVEHKFVVAGGAVLNLVVFGDEAVTDIDIFSPDPEGLLNKLGVDAQKNGNVYRVGSVDIIEFPDAEDYAASVIGSFDFNVTACAWAGESEPILCASEPFVRAISTGTLDFLPHFDPMKSRSRTAHRAARFMKRLSYHLSPRLESFLKDYLRDMPRWVGTERVFQIGSPLGYAKVSLSELRRKAISGTGPSHPLSLLVH